MGSLNSKKHNADVNDIDRKNEYISYQKKRISYLENQLLLLNVDTVQKKKKILELESRCDKLKNLLKETDE